METTHSALGTVVPCLCLWPREYGVPNLANTANVPPPVAAAVVSNDTKRNDVTDGLGFNQQSSSFCSVALTPNGLRLARAAGGLCTASKNQNLAHIASLAKGGGHCFFRNCRLLASNEHLDWPPTACSTSHIISSPN